MDSRTGINRLRCIPEEDFVAASVVDGLILSSAAISGGNLGQPVILNPGVRSNDSIIFNGQIYNCTGQGIYRYQLSTDASGQKSGVYPDTAETFLESVPVYCATEYSGSVIVGTLSGVFALSSIIKNEDWTSKVAELASNVTEPL